MARTNNVSNFYDRNPDLKNNSLYIRLYKDMETKQKFEELKNKTGLTSPELLKVLIESFTKPKPNLSKAREAWNMLENSKK